MPAADAQEVQATASEGAAGGSTVNAFDGKVGTEPAWIKRSRRLGPMRSHQQGKTRAQQPMLLAGPTLPPCSNLEERIFKLPSGRRGPESRRHCCHEDIVTVLQGSMEFQSAEMLLGDIQRLPEESPGTIGVMESRLVKQRQQSPRVRSTDLASKVYTSPVILPMSPSSARVRRQSRKLQPLSQAPLPSGKQQAVGPLNGGSQQPQQPQQQQQQDHQQNPQRTGSPRSPRAPKPNTEAVAIPELTRLDEDDVTLVPSETEARTGESPEVAQLGESIGAWLEQGVDKAVERWDKLETMDFSETVRVDSPLDDLSRNTSRRSRSSERGVAAILAQEAVGNCLP